MIDKAYTFLQMETAISSETMKSTDMAHGGTLR
jgi:hypothetical protein